MPIQTALISCLVLTEFTRVRFLVRVFRAHVQLQRTTVHRLVPALRTLKPLLQRVFRAHMRLQMVAPHSLVLTLVATEQFPVLVHREDVTLQLGARRGLVLAPRAGVFSQSRVQRHVRLEVTDLVERFAARCADVWFLQRVNGSVPRQMTR